MRRVHLGPVGIWWSGSWRAERVDAATGAGDAPGSVADVAAEMESLGYSTLWTSAGFEPGLPPIFERLLEATTSINVASGIASIWATAPADLFGAVTRLEARHPGRFVLGLGASHAVIAEGYARPYSHMVEYLDELDGLGGRTGPKDEVPGVAQDHRVLAALGPRMLELARDRAAGAHPYFVPAEHTARARQALGPGPVLAPEVTVVLERDPSTARALARTFTSLYLTLPNYSNNLRSLGFTDDDLAGGGSDRLVDAVVCWGDLDAVAAKVGEHRQAGADHVCIQVISPVPLHFPLAQYRALAPALMS